MTQDQNSHLNGLMFKFTNLLDAKYRAGARKHRGDLQSKSILELLIEARAECIDQFTYLQTAIDKLEKELDKKKGML